MTQNLISATIVADSINPQGDRITTFELVFPRFILAELNTHRVFTKNSASSRAIPFAKMVREVTERPFVPIAWQKHHKGMQGNEYITGEESKRHPIATWLRARDYAIKQATLLHDNCGVTKQLANRLLEPFLYHKVLLTATEFENFFNLRSPQYVFPGKPTERSWKDSSYGQSNVSSDFDDTHKLLFNEGEAEIHIMDLAEKMWDTYYESKPKELKEGEWHIPYSEDLNNPEVEKEILSIIDPDDLWQDDLGHLEYQLEQAKIKIATARCARISYQTLGDNPKIDFKKDLDLFESLKDSEHWSPYEHCAKAMTMEYIERHPVVQDLQYDDKVATDTNSYQYTYILDVNEDKIDTPFCRNFKGWIQLRAMLD